MSAVSMIRSYSDKALKAVADYLRVYHPEDWRERQWIKERKQIVEAELNNRRKASKP